MVKAPRGTRDIQPAEQRYWRYVEEKAINLTRKYGFNRLDTPVFEDSTLFAHSVGEGTDIMDKETYTFQDRGNDFLTLRPEGTAPICRAYLEHGIHNSPQPVRFYYFCPVFRYDRPQAGRYRQHHQFGIEILGDSDALVDAEVVQIAWTLMADLGLKDLSLMLNNIGDTQCRPNYIQALRNYYSTHTHRICSDCRKRLKNNPLRLLDCKRELCQPLQQEAPVSTDHLCRDCQEHWDQFRRYLEVMEIDYAVDHRLVRGLDYYTRTVFEIVPAENSSQSTLLGGGRYDGLIERIGGRPTPGVGFATGLERLILNVKSQGVEVPEEERPEYFIATMDEKGTEVAVKLAAQLRVLGVAVILGPRGRRLRGQMRNANFLGVVKVIIIGEDELATGSLTLKDMITGDQRTLSIEKFLCDLNPQ